MPCAVALGEVIVACCLSGDDEVGPVINHLKGLVIVYVVLPALVASESAVILEIIVTHHIGFSVRRSRTETYRADEPRDEGGDGILLGNERYLLHVYETAYHEQAENICLGLLPCSLFIFKSLIHRTFPVHSLLHAKPVGNLVESNVPEKRLRPQMFLLVRLDEQTSDRKEYLAELGGDAVVKLETSGSFHSLDAVIVRKIDGDGLAAGVAVPRIIYRVIYIQVRGCARHECLVLLRAREHLLQVWKHGDVFSELGAALFILQEDETFV